MLSCSSDPAITLSRSPVPISRPFMHSTTVLPRRACIGASASRERRLWEPMEMMTVSACSTSRRSVVSPTESGSVSRSFCRVARKDCIRGELCRPYSVT